MRNLRDTGIGNNQTENMASDMNREVESKVGKPRKCADNECKRDPEIVRNLMDLRIKKMSLEAQI